MLELELTAAAFNPARGIRGAVDLQIIVASFRTRFRFWIAHEITAFMVSTNGSQKKRVQPIAHLVIMATTPILLALLRPGFRRPRRRRPGAACRRPADVQFRSKYRARRPLPAMPVCFPVPASTR